MAEAAGAVAVCADAVGADGVVSRIQVQDSGSPATRYRRADFRSEDDVLVLRRAGG